VYQPACMDFTQTAIASAIVPAYESTNFTLHDTQNLNESFAEP
jgi:hypothetical protein